MNRSKPAALAHAISRTQCFFNGSARGGTVLYSTNLCVQRGKYNKCPVCESETAYKTSPYRFGQEQTHKSYKLPPYFPFSFCKERMLNPPPHHIKRPKKKSQYNNKYTKISYRKSPCTLPAEFTCLSLPFVCV